MAPIVLSLEQLLQIMPRLPRANALGYLPHLQAVLDKEGISKTPQRVAYFLGQLALESGELRWWSEFADGSAYERPVINGKPAPLVVAGGAVKVPIWQKLGNLEPGDGPRFKGRGPPQLTGRDNYRAAGLDLGVDFLKQPELVERVDMGFRVAGWFWRTRGCEVYADAGRIEPLTKAWNGGYTHLDQRRAYTEKALKVLGG